MESYDSKCHNHGSRIRRKSAFLSRSSAQNSTACPIDPSTTFTWTLGMGPWSWPRASVLWPAVCAWGLWRGLVLILSQHRPASLTLLLSMDCGQSAVQSNAAQKTPRRNEMHARKSTLATTTTAAAAAAFPALLLLQQLLLQTEYRYNPIAIGRCVHYCGSSLCCG